MCYSPRHSRGVFVFLLGICFGVLPWTCGGSRSGGVADESDLGGDHDDERGLLRATPPSPPEARALADSIPPDVRSETWSQVVPTLLISVATWFLLLFLYEVCRRTALLRGVFDRRRDRRPTRCPPPLMTTRSPEGAWRWCPALLEYWFVAMDEEYLAYSAWVDKIKKKNVTISKWAGNRSEQDSALDASSSHGGRTSVDEEDPDRKIKFKDEEKGTAGNKERDGAGGDDEKHSSEGVDPNNDDAVKEEGGTNASNEKPDEDDEAILKRPSRLRRFWITPGFTVGLFDPRKCIKGESRFRGRSTFLQPRELSEADRTLLRLIGLDSFVMIRFLRFAFDCTFYPFCVACITIIPTYYTNNYDGEYVKRDDGSFLATTTYGYFRFTINKLQANSPKLWVAFIYAAAYYLFVLRRHYIEWITFFELRMDYLANGDADAFKEDDAISQKQSRNSCVVEYVPKSHRSNKDMNFFFDSLFPGKIEHAEVILNTERLTSLVMQRQNAIEQYENVFAKQHYARFVYEEHSNAQSEGKLKRGCVGSCARAPREPHEIQVRVGGSYCFGGEKKDALVYYQSEINRLNDLVEKEYQIVVKKYKDSEREARSLRQSIIASNNDETLADQLCRLFDPAEWHSGASNNASNGFVEFKTRVAKQAAIQANLTGEANHMVTLGAPDPRDLIWENVTFGRSGIKVRRLGIQLVLIVGILFWSAVVTGITNIFNRGTGDDTNNGGVNDRGSDLFGLVRSYLPVLTLTIILAIFPGLFRFLGTRVIGFRSNSEADKFTFLWVMLYRIANILVIVISGTLWQAAESFGQNPTVLLRSFTNGLLRQSQFLLNIVLIAAGQETMMQLFQPPSVLFMLLVRISCTLEGLSERKLEWIKTPKPFIFGRFCPSFMYVFMIAVIYSTMVPLILGAASVYFFLATKVYEHQSLWVFYTPYEGGGKMMYLINRALFVFFYITVVIFSVVLVLKQAPVQSGLFLVGMTLVTISVDRIISEQFVTHSMTLPISRARITDENYKELIAKGTEHKDKKHGEGTHGSNPNENRRKMFQRSHASRCVLRNSVGMGIGQPPLGEDVEVEGDINVDYYLYRQPVLHKAAWETEPRPYRRSIGQDAQK